MGKKLFKQLEAEIDPAFAERAQVILSTVENRKHNHILEVGCGRGFYMKTLSQLPGVTKIEGIDINPHYVAIAQNFAKHKKVHIQQASAYKLPFKSNSFDIVISTEVLEHLEDDTTAVREMYRVLKPGGRLLITVPNERFPFLWDPLNWILMKLFHTHVSKNIWWLAGIWADHIRLYTIGTIKKTIRSSHFVIKKSKLIVHWSFPFSHFLLYGIGKNLVERTPFFGDMNRFKVQKSNGSFLSSCMSLPSRLFDRRFPTQSSVNIFIEAIKE